MSELSDGCKKMLVEALQSDEPQEKDYYIRQVLQACNVTDLPEDVNIESGIPD